MDALKKVRRGIKQDVRDSCRFIVTIRQRRKESVARLFICHLALNSSLGVSLVVVVETSTFLLFFHISQQVKGSNVKGE